MCEDYLITFHKSDIITIIQEEEATKHFSININFIVLYEHQPNLVLELLKKPEECLEEWDKATLKVQMALLKEVDTKSPLKNNVHCRIFHLPVFTEVRRTVFPGNDDAGKFLEISGTVMRISAAKLLEYQRSYVCVKCKYPMTVKAEYDKKYIIKQPKKCGNPEGCQGTNLITFGELDRDNCKDYQEIKVQEQVKKQGVGSMPNTMWVTLEDDLVDSCKPGNNVTICGIVKRRWGELCIGNKIDIDIVLKANNVQVDNNSRSLAASTPEIKEMFRSFWEKYSGDPLAGRDLILKSFCPQIYGMYLVKLAVAIVLAGGSQTDDTTSTGVRTRSESHLLLVGDPGTGKSELLRFVSKIIPRSVLTTGVGSTAAGLTVTAMMECGEWQLEGGALVMADGGICCIDEFNSMKEHDRTSIHEAMEQQTISVAKASIVCKLNTRCSILAACNPKGNLDPTQPLCMNIALPSPLLSRFDLILLLRDVVDGEWDAEVADYILNGGHNFSKLTDSGLWSIDMLQSYFMVIKKFNPKLSENAETILSTYYQMQRRIDSRNKARTTVRLLESLVRLSQGHARLMYHEEVETVDSIYAIILVDTVMESDSSILNLNVSTHSVFPGCPIRDYCGMLEIVLNKLQLRDILDKEIETIRKRNTENRFLENVRSRFFNAQNKPSDNTVGIEESDEFKDNLDQIINDDLIIKKNMKVISTDASQITENSESKKRASVKEAPNHAKRVKKANENDLAIDLDEGYDTVSFTNSNVLRNKPGTKKMATLNKVKHKADNNSRMEETEGTRSDHVREKTCSRLNDNMSNTEAASESSKEEGLSTNITEKSSDSNTPESNVDLVCPRTAENNSEGKVVEVKKSIIRDKLKKFKFVQKPSDDMNKILDKITESNVRTDGPSLKKSTAVNKTVDQNGRKTKRNDLHEAKVDCVKDDLAMLQFMPSANDDLKVDLDFDWDNFRQNSSDRSQNIDLCENTNEKNCVTESLQNSKLNPSNRQFEKKLSDDNMFNKIIRVDSSVSSQSSKRTMFDTSDENIDDLDLDI